MAKGPLITDKVKQLIAETYLEHPDWRAKEIQYEVDHLLIGKGPGLSAVQKQLTKIRRRHGEITSEPEDGPWNVATLEQYPIPAEALPSVLHAWIYVREHINISFTVRQAKWVARLYAVIKDIPNLVTAAWYYNQNELVTRITESDAKPDTEGVDLNVFELMTGEQLSIERGFQILGINREHFDSTVDSKTKDKHSIESFARYLRRRRETTSVGVSNFTYQTGIWNMIKAYSMLTGSAKSIQDRENRLAKFAEFMEEYYKSRVEVPEEKKEAQNERAHKKER